MGTILTHHVSESTAENACGARSWSFYILGAGETPAPQPEATAASIVVQASSLP